MREVIYAKAPTRIDFAGGFTDVAPYSLEIGGLVLNASITRFTYCHASSRSDQKTQLFLEDSRSLAEFDLDTLRRRGTPFDLFTSAAKVSHIRIGFNLWARSDVPLGSGLGSSASMSLATLACLYALQRKKVGRLRLAEAAYRLEVNELGIIGGRQDQYAAALGGFNLLEFTGLGVKVQRLQLGESVLRILKDSMILCDTGQVRASGRIISHVVESYREQDKRVLQALDTMKNTAKDLVKPLVEADVRSIGELVALNWEAQKSLHYSVLTKPMEKVFESARQAGALGGKACGAGGGGCLVLVCESQNRAAVSRSVEKAGCRLVDFGFADRGLQVRRVMSV